MPPSASTKRTPSICGTSWDITVPKSCIFVDKIGFVQLRLEALRDCVESSSSKMVAFSEVRISPLSLSITADKLANKHLGDRPAYAPLTRGMGEAAAQHILSQVLPMLEKLHERHLTHGHLNIQSFLRRNGGGGEIVMTDHLLPVSLFVPSSPIGRSARQLAAPEIRRNEPFGSAADVWGIGVVLLELLLPAERSFDADDIIDTDLLSPFVVSFSPTTRALLMQCLKGDAAKRPMLSDLMEHPFFLFSQSGARRQSAVSGTDSSDDESSDGSSSSGTNGGDGGVEDETEDDEEDTDSDDGAALAAI